MNEYIDKLVEGILKEDEALNITDKVLNDFVIFYADDINDMAVYVYISPEHILLFKLDPDSEELIVPILPVYINTSSIKLNDEKSLILIYDRDNGAYVNPEDFLEMKPEADIFYYDDVTESFVKEKPTIVH